jgi:N-formylglutamate deformylase
MLPVFNIGTNDGRPAAPPAIEALAGGICRGVGFDTVVNGRFKGGWTTRRTTAIRTTASMPSRWSSPSAPTWTEAPPWTYQPDLADVLRKHLRTLLNELRSAAL